MKRQVSIADEREIWTRYRYVPRFSTNLMYHSRPDVPTSKEVSTLMERSFSKYSKNYCTTTNFPNIRGVRA